MNYVVVPIRNCRQLTQAAIESLLAQDIPTRVLAIDGSSTDGVASYLRSLHPRVQTVTLPPRTGVSKAWNLALRHLFDVVGVEHVLVANNDIKVSRNLYQLLLSDGGGFVTGVSTDEEASLKPLATVGERRPHPDFSCFLIRKWVWQKVGEFDEAMRLYASDGSYHLRMHRAGVEAYTNGVPFYHYACGTLKEADEDEQHEIEEQAERDREAFERQWGFPMGSKAYYETFGVREPE